MKFIHSSRMMAFCLSAVLASTALTQAQPGMGKKADKPSPGMKRAEMVAGHPLTEAQKKAIRGAIATRKKAMKPLQDQFDATVAKTLGMTVDAYKAKVKALAPPKPKA